MFCTLFCEQEINVFCLFACFLHFSRNGIFAPVELEYDRFSRVTKWKWGDMTETYGFDRAGRLDEIRYGDETAMKYAFKDMFSNLVSLKRMILNCFYYIVIIINGICEIEEERKGMYWNEYNFFSSVLSFYCHIKMNFIWLLFSCANVIIKVSSNFHE